MNASAARIGITLLVMSLACPVHAEKGEMDLDGPKVATGSKAKARIEGSVSTTVRTLRALGWEQEASMLRSAVTRVKKSGRYSRAEVRQSIGKATLKTSTGYEAVPEGLVPRKGTVSGDLIVHDGKGTAGHLHPANWKTTGRIQSQLQLKNIWLSVNDTRPLYFQGQLQRPRSTASDTGVQVAAKQGKVSIRTTRTVDRNDGVRFTFHQALDARKVGATESGKPVFLVKQRLDVRKVNQEEGFACGTIQVEPVSTKYFLRVGSRLAKVSAKRAEMISNGFPISKLGNKLSLSVSLLRPEALVEAYVSRQQRNSFNGPRIASSTSTTTSARPLSWKARFRKVGKWISAHMPRRR